MLKVGISSIFIYPDISRAYYGSKILSLWENEMASYLSKEEALPLLIPNLETKMLYKFLDQIDALIIQGGPDLDPKTYGETPINPDKWPGDPYLDKYNKKILDYFRNKKKPILGICRGCQYINCYFGGTLYQDLLTQYPEALMHRDAFRYDALSHSIKIHPGGILEPIYGLENLKPVNSIHHQGIKKLGKGLKIEATSLEDNIIEAISYTKDEEFILGVQWHPEFYQLLKDEILNPHILLQTFLKKCNT